jgi:hypothetical protein
MEPDAGRDVAGGGAEDSRTRANVKKMKSRFRVGAAPTWNPKRVKRVACPTTA